MQQSESDALYIAASDLEWDCKVSAKKYWNEEKALAQADNILKTSMVVAGVVSTTISSAGAASVLFESQPRLQKASLAFGGFCTAILTALIPIKKYEERAVACKEIADGYDDLEKRIRIFRDSKSHSDAVRDAEKSFQNRQNWIHTTLESFKQHKN